MSEPLGGQELIEVAAAYIADDPGTTYRYLYERLCRDYEVNVGRRSFVSGGYATAAKRLAQSRMNAENEETPEPPRPSVHPTPLPDTALSPAELAAERAAFRRREAARRREQERKARERNLRLYGTPHPPRRGRGKGNRNHPFQRDFVLGKQSRKNGAVLGPVEYLPPIEFVETGVRRR